MLKKAAVRREEVLSKLKSVQLQIKTLSLVSLFTLLSNSREGERDTLTNSHILLVALNSNDLLKAPNSYSSEREIMLGGTFCLVRLQQAVGVRYFCIIGVCQTVKRCAARVLSSIPSKAFVPVVSAQCQQRCHCKHSE